MIYDLPRYTITLTFICVIDSRLTLNILKVKPLEPTHEQASKFFK